MEGKRERERETTGISYRDMNVCMWIWYPVSLISYDVNSIKYLESTIVVYAYLFILCVHTCTYIYICACWIEHIEIALHFFLTVSKRQAWFRRTSRSVTTTDICMHSTEWSTSFGCTKAAAHMPDAIPSAMCKVRSNQNVYVAGFLKISSMWALLSK